MVFKKDLEAADEMLQSDSKTQRTFGKLIYVCYVVVLVLCIWLLIDCARALS